LEIGGGDLGLEILRLFKLFYIIIIIFSDTMKSRRGAEEDRR